MNTASIQLLLVEDNSADALILEELLTEVPAVSVDLMLVKRLSEAIQKLRSQLFDIILLDLSLPDSCGLETLVQVQKQAATVPIVVMTGLDSEDMAVEAVSLGAQDYLVKGKVDPHLLMRAIRYAIERKRTAEALRLQAEREHLLGLISQRIRQSLDLALILQTTVTEVQQFLAADRVLVYRFNADWSGIVVAESVADGWSSLYGVTIKDHCLNDNYLNLYPGRSRAIEDIHTANLTQCHIDLLAKYQVKANLVVPILHFPGEWERGAGEPGSRGAGEPGSRGAGEPGEQGSRGAEEPGSRGAEEPGSRGAGEPGSRKTVLSSTPPLSPSPLPKLWGLLIVHQCSQARSWQPWETDLLKSLSTQVGIAIQQSELYQQVQQLNADLERQVQERTAQLQRSLDAEGVLKRITDKVRDSLDENQILPTAVRELALGLEAESAQAALYDLEKGTATIRYEYTRSGEGWTGHMVVLSNYLDIYRQLVSGIEADLRDPALDGVTIYWSNSPKEERRDAGIPYPPFQFCELFPTRSQRREAILACPLVDEQEVLGDLWLFKATHKIFNELEIRLVQQVATQCAIALRQARLYQASQVQIRELEKLNLLKDDFLSTVSHELRTPIANIKMAIQMLEVALTPVEQWASKLEEQEKEKISTILTSRRSIFLSKTDNYLQILHDECDREINLINDLLDLQRLNAGVHPLELTTIQMQNWILHILEPFAQRMKREKQNLLVDISPTLPPLICDRSSLSRIFTELINNACKYTPKGEEISVKAWAEAERLHLQIANSGAEIPASELPHIFDKFYRVPSSDPWKQGGTGLGLALVQKLTDYLGGKIQVESAVGITCFTVELPLNPAGVEAYTGVGNGEWGMGNR